MLILIFLFLPPVILASNDATADQATSASVTGSTSTTIPLTNLSTLATKLLVATDEAVQNGNIHDLTSTDVSSTTDLEPYRLLENYFPLFYLLIALPENDTQNLAEYMNQKGYAQLKTMIDQKQKENSIAEIISEFEANNTDFVSFIQTEDNKLYVDLVEAYHNASIYSVIRGIWNSQLTPILPVIDQVAILEYFAERKSAEALEMSFWARLWAALKAWLSGKRDFNGGGLDCYADSPRCVRRAVETMPMESRIELDRAAREENCELVDNIITSQLSSFSDSDRHEFENWRTNNQPPEVLQHIINNVSDVEKTSLERLRKHDLIHSLKDYYRAMIESRPHHEQLVLREFFEKMNNSFAGCYNPIRGQYEYN